MAGKTLETNQPGLASDMNTIGQWGLAAAIPAIEDVVAGSFYYETDTKKLRQAQNVWVDISGADLSITTAVVGDVRDGKTFFAVEKPIKTGTMPVRTLSPANETVLEGFYVATTLSAVDADLTPAKIKKDVTIFGKLGTYQNTLAEDILGDAQGTAQTTYQEPAGWQWRTNVVAGGDVTLVSLVQAYDADSLAVGVVSFFGGMQGINQGKIQLVMDGVMVTESAYLLTDGDPVFLILLGTRALSGSTTCLARVHNYDVSDRWVYVRQIQENDERTVIIAVGSVKLA